MPSKRRKSKPRTVRVKLVQPALVSGKKFTAIIDTGRSRPCRVSFGAVGYSDYTKHKDSARKSRYVSRHGRSKSRSRGGETWSKSGLCTAGFWSRWLLWNKPSLAASKRDMASRFGIKFVSSL